MLNELKRLLNGSPIATIGGGNRFLPVLRAEWQRQGVHADVGNVGKATKAVLLNGSDFTDSQLRKLEGLERGRVRILHRIEGIADKRTVELNHKFADATVFPSLYSSDRHEALGIKLKDPHVISNAVDSKIFQPPSGRKVHDKVKIVALQLPPPDPDDPAEQKKPRFFEWLRAQLDPDRFRLSVLDFSEIAPDKLAELLRDQDLYIAASEDEPCSNALLEALSCGLPTVYRKSGGHPELVKGGGEGFTDFEQVLDAIERVLGSYDLYRARIATPRLADVAKEYLSVMGIS
jgi:glycosyltransferase involved in cell wall biosynthesis